jgi:Flp pilus assembly protein TadD
MLYRALEMYDEAEAWSRSAIMLAPKDGGIHALISTIQFLRGDLEGAKQELDAAQALSPTHGVVLRTIHYHGARQGDFETARDAGELLRANLSKDFLDTVLQGYVYDRLGDHKRARSLYAEGRRNADLLIERGTTNPFPYLELARLAILDSDRDKALHMLDGAYERGMGLYSVRMDPILAKLEGDPAYARFVARMEVDVARMRERVRATEKRQRK